MNRYYIDGAECDEATAREAFMSHHWRVMVGDAACQWRACKSSEDARDNYLPSHIEIVQGAQ